MMYGYGMGAGGWIVMILIWLLVVALIGYIVVRIFPGGGTRPAAAVPPAPRTPPETPRQILDRRLASGEIDVETYDRLRAHLTSGGSGT